MKAVLLDADTLGTPIDLSPIDQQVDSFSIYPSTTPEQVIDHLGDADLILTNKVVITKQHMLGRKAILVMATGTNNIDLEAAEQLGIPVINVVNYGTDSVAQHTLMMMLSLAAKLPQYQSSLSKGAWERSPFFCLTTYPTMQLTNKNLVIVGHGNLGKKVSELATAFGMNVYVSSRPGNTTDSRPSLDELLPIADVVSFHCPLNTHTRHLLNMENISLLKETCLVINWRAGEYYRRERLP